MPKYIDAEKFAEHVSENLSWNGERYDAASVISDLKTFPAADVEPKRKMGRWIAKKKNLTEGAAYMIPLTIRYFVCSLCGREEDNAEPYCNCGAKMDAEPPKEEPVNEITPEMIEAAERNEKQIKERVDRIYDELIAEKRAEIERLEAEIAKMPPFDAEKLAAIPIVPSKEADNGNK